MSTMLNNGDPDPTELYKSETVAKEYDRVRFSSLAGRVFNTRERSIIRRCFENYPSETVILDMPCGTGRLAEALLEAGLRVYGGDISEEMLDVAKARLKIYGDRFCTEVMDAFAQPACIPRFDAALCARILMHFPLERQIAFLRGVVANTKQVVVINHCLNSPYQRFRRWVKKLLRHQRPARYPVTNDEIARLLAASGLTEVARHRMYPVVSEAVYIVAKKI